MAPTARAASADDLPAVVDLVEEMFAALGTATSDEWRVQCQRVLVARIQHDVGIFVVDNIDHPGPPLAACAVGVLHQSLPSPRRDGVNVGYIEWVATHHPLRRRGYARAASVALVEWLTTNGAAVIDVHSSANAGGLYRGLGFREAGPTALRLPTRHFVPPSPADGRSASKLPFPRA